MQSFTFLLRESRSEIVQNNATISTYALFQTNDENKRKVLGDVIYLIRFPTMDPDEFVKDVATSAVLTPEEALDIVIHVKKSKPRNTLPFSDKPRTGTWREQLFNCSYHYESAGYSLDQYFNLQGNAEVASVYFLNASGYSITNLSLQSAKARIKPIENRQHCGRQLNEAVFDPPVKLQSGSHMVSVNCGGSYFNFFSATGHNTLQFKPITITMNAKSWNTIVGFKLKSSN